MRGTLPGECREELLRNGYWTGRPCRRPAKYHVSQDMGRTGTFRSRGEVCGIHKNQIVNVGWPTEVKELGS